MADLLTPQFQYQERAIEVFSKKEYDAPFLYDITEKRDKDLEQYLWAPYNHTAEVIQTADQTFPNSTRTRFTFDSATFDPEGMFDFSTDEFVIPIEGVWHIQGGWNMSGGGSTSTWGVEIGINFTFVPFTLPQYFIWFSPSFSSGNTATASRNIPLKVGDRVGLYGLYIQNGSPITEIVTLATSDRNNPYFEATYVSNYDVNKTLT